MTEPDYVTWTNNILTLSKRFGTAQDEIEKALKEAFQQGYQLGLNKGWAIEQDKLECDHDWYADEFGAFCGKCGDKT